MKNKTVIGLTTFCLVLAHMIVLGVPNAFGSPTTATLHLQESNRYTTGSVDITVCYATQQTTAMLSFEVDFYNKTTQSLSWHKLSRGMKITMYDSSKSHTLLPLPGLHDQPWLLWRIESTVPPGKLAPATTGTMIMRCRAVPKSQLVFNPMHIRAIEPGSYSVGAYWSDPFTEAPSRMAASGTCILADEPGVDPIKDREKCLHVLPVD